MNAKTWLFGLLAVCAVGLLLSCNDSEVKLLDDPAEDGDTDKASFNPGDDNLDDDDEDGDADDDDNDDADGDNPDGDTPADDDDDTTDDDDDDDDTTEDGDLPDGDTDGDIDDIYVSETPIYVDGLLTVATISVDEGQDEAPVPMLIHTPTQAGEYAVVVFQHGFLLANHYYNTLLKRLASHGFVVVVPQMYEAGGLPLGKPTSVQEAGTAQTVYDWLQVHLSNHVGVTPRLDRLGLAGHSRGGKVIWSVLKLNSSGVRAVAGVDPVDSNIGNDPAVITGSFGFSFPSLIIGTGYGPDGLAACAPAGNNHVQFYEASAPLAFHIVATEYGHNDVLDDNPDGCGLTCTVCKAGDSREPMRTLTAGLLVAFFRATLQGATDNYVHLADADSAPVTVTMEAKNR